MFPNTPQRCFENVTLELMLRGQSSQSQCSLAIFTSEHREQVANVTFAPDNYTVEGRLQHLHKAVCFSKFNPKTAKDTCLKTSLLYPDFQHLSLCIVALHPSAFPPGRAHTISFSSIASFHDSIIKIQLLSWICIAREIDMTYQGSCNPLSVEIGHICLC